MFKAFIALIFMFGFTDSSPAQKCEAMVVKNTSGAVILSKLMCRGKNGVWEERDPAPPPKAALLPPAPTPSPPPSQPVTQPLVSAPAPSLAVTEPAPPATEAFVSPPAPTVIAPTPTPAPSAEVALPAAVEVTPILLPEEPIQAVVLPPIEPEPEPVVIEPYEFTVIQPTDPEPQATLLPQQSGTRDPGWEERHRAYAKLGLSCEAEQAMFCTSNSCSGLCSGVDGWCDGRTGKRYNSLQAIERTYCRKR